MRVHVVAWTAAAPVAALRATETALPPGFQGVAAAPESRDRSRGPPRDLREDRRGDVRRPALYTGKGAVGLCTDVILPAAEDALAASYRDWGPMAC